MSTPVNVKTSLPRSNIPTESIGIFGGTFDPIHFGHIKPAQDLAKQLSLDHVVLMPAHIPPHKHKTHANSKQRKCMVELVCQQNPMFILDERELQRTTPSYTFDSISELRALHPNSKLYFFIGTDSLNTLSSWYNIEQLLELCHFAVSTRPGYQADLSNIAFFKDRICHGAEQIGENLAGKIILLNTCKINISSTELRARLRAGHNCQQFLPNIISQFIDHNKLYQE